MFDVVTGERITRKFWKGIGVRDIPDYYLENMFCFVGYSVDPMTPKMYNSHKPNQYNGVVSPGVGKYTHSAAVSACVEFL